jgi:predicted dehydrogenase
MEQGKHVATEVPAAMTLDECWAPVDTAEKTRRHCILIDLRFGESRKFQLRFLWILSDCG